MVIESSVKTVLVAMVAKVAIARYTMNFLIFKYRLHQVSATTVCDSDLDLTQEVIFPPELKVSIIIAHHYLILLGQCNEVSTFYTRT